METSAPAILELALLLLAAAAAAAAGWLARRAGLPAVIGYLAVGALVSPFTPGFVSVPMALAAFIAGLTISESHHAQEARRRLLPFRDLFAVLFFVAIGTLIDPGQLVVGWGWLLALLAMALVAEGGLSYLLARLSRLAARPLQLAVGLGQVGEFSFVLASLGLASGELDRPLCSAMLAAVAISIGASSVAVRLVGPTNEPLPA